MSEAAAQIEPVESPCVQICRLDERGLCVGCFRTAEEIGNWLSYSAERRKEISATLPDRSGSVFDSA